VLRFWRREQKVAEVPASIPAGERIYAIGDIHGRLDLLRKLMSKIVEDAADAPDVSRRLIFIGDYVDRGMDSRSVIDLLLEGQPDGFAPSVYLKGNHEDAMLKFLEHPSAAQQWLSYGGLATLYSYGVAMQQERSPSEEKLANAAEKLAAKLPETHREFLDKLQLSTTVGDYFFVHAGVRPGVPLEAQDEEDMLWIRDEFLSSTAKFGKIVVHGHTISQKPEVLPNRIGIDTGAFATGRLTCVVLEAEHRRFLFTGG
jgi:serine/threonine protein phosphatase 1